MNAETVSTKHDHYTVVMVPSTRDPSKMYRVDVVNRRCSCPGWIYQRGPHSQHKLCKHLKALGFKEPGKPEPMVQNGVLFEEAL